MINIDNLENLAKELEFLLESKKLLDRVLSYYNFNSGQFNTIPEYDATYIIINPNGTFNTDTLNYKIRKYLNFDDSE